MSFIKESKKAYKQVQENHIAIAMGKMLDDEGSMVLNQLEELERAIKMIRDYVGTDYEKQLPAWVQAKVTLASDYISTVGNYLSSKNEKVTEEAIKEEFDLEETSLAAIHKMKEDGKTTEEIAKELKLNAGLVKKILGEEVELQKKPKVKKQKDQTNNIPQNIEPTNASGANTQVGLSMGEETFKDNIVNKLVKPVQDYNKKAAEKRTIDMTDGSAHVRFPKDDTKAMEFYKSKGYKVTTKYEEVEIQEEPKLNQKNLDKFHISLDKLVHKTFGSSSDEKKKQEPKKEEVKEPTGNLKDACWTGYVAVGTKMKNGKRVPNCVPKSEAYKGAKAIVENAFKKLKEKK
jgi:hypothetical protein